MLIDTPTIAASLILAGIGEGIIEAIKPALAPLSDRINIDPYLYISLLLGVLLAVSYQADIFTLLNLGAGLPYVGMILTGILIGRGANFVHDIISRIQPPSAPTKQ